MKAMFSLLALIGLTTDLIAHERILKTIDGKTFKGEITNVEPDGITISHEEGISKIALSRFPENIQLEFGYDPAKAAAYKTTTAKAVAAQRTFQADLAKRVASAQPVATPVPAAQQSVQQPQTGPSLLINSGKGASTPKGLSMSTLKK